MTLRAAAALASAAILIAGCGGASPSAQPDAQETVVAQPVAPPELPELPKSASGQADDSRADSDVGPDSADPSVAKIAAKRSHRSPRRSTSILSPADQASFRRLQGTLGGESGLAVSGLGIGRRVERVGSLRSAVAWSTAKVPV